MMQQPNSAKVKSALNPYLKQQIQTASPEKLILILYDLAIKCCHTQDRQMAVKVLVELISALNFDHKEMSLLFFDLYKYALDNIHQGKFEEPLMIFEELREVWESTVMSQAKVRSIN
ncbi:MAG: flagellar export chaperone FliS [bacterium]